MRDLLCIPQRRICSVVVNTIGCRVPTTKDTIAAEKDEHSQPNGLQICIAIRNICRYRALSPWTLFPEIDRRSPTAVPVEGVNSRS